MSFNESDGGQPGSPLKLNATSPADINDIEMKHYSSMNKIVEKDDSNSEEEELDAYSPEEKTGNKLHHTESKEYLELDKTGPTIESSRHLDHSHTLEID